MKNKLPITIICEKDNIYKRLVGKAITHKVASDRPLDINEIEQFRIWPESMLTHNENYAA